MISLQWQDGVLSLLDQGAYPQEEKWLTCNTWEETAQALAAEALFTRLSLPGRIIPLPSRISAGCGLAWKAAPGDQAVLTAALEENGIGHGPCCVLEMF